MVRFQLMCAVAAVSVTGLAARGGTFKGITIDGTFDDWTGVPVLTHDPAGDGNPIDIGDIQIANDADNLYLRVSYNTPVNPNVGPSLYLAFDTDRNTATGYNVFGLGVVGSEAAFQNDFPFEQRTLFNSGSLTAAATISPVDFGDPGHTFNSQEYSIPRNIAYSSDNVPVFGAAFNTGFNILFYTDSSIAADTSAVLSYDFAVPVNSFTNASGGDYNLATNWSAGTVPNAIDAVGVFGAAITAPQTVFSNAAVTAGALSFDNANTYVLGGTGSLTLDVSTGTAAINVLAGSQKINLPLRLNDSTVATVATGSTLTIADPLTLANGSTLTKNGAGTLEIISTVASVSGAGTILTTAGTSNLRLNVGAGTSISSTGGVTRAFATQRVSAVSITGGTVALDSTGLAKVLDTDALTIAGGATPTGTFDIGDNAAIVRYSGTSPAAAIRALIKSGRAVGGLGITTTASTANRGIGYANSNQIGSPTSFAGQSFTGTAVLIRYTLLGDANLTGNVNFDDLINLAQNYNGTNKEWFQGDFNYDGTVNFDDLIPLAQNYNGVLPAGLSAASVGGAGFAADWALAQSLVPEPTSLAAIGLGAFAFGRRAKRSMACEL